VHLIVLILSALWRAQAAHLGLFVVVPGAAAVFRAVAGVVLLPFLLLGGADRTVSFGGEVAHLLEPGCWVALLPCSFAERVLYEPETSSGRSSAASTGSTAAEPEPLLPVPKAIVVRHAWFAAWLLWFLVYLVRRERQGGS
jgi:hypothetical protein